MIGERVAPLLEQNDSRDELAALLKIVSAANRSCGLTPLVEDSLAALRTHFPYSLAFFLVVEFDPPHFRVEPSQAVSPALRADLDALHMPDEFFCELDSPDGASRLETLVTRLTQILAAHHYLKPDLIPLTADGRGLGVLVLAGPSHPEAAESIPPQLQNAIAAEIGVALRRLQLEKQRRATEEWARAFIASSPEGFWEADGNGVVRFANDAALEIIGYPRQRALGHTFEQLGVIESSAWADLIEQLSRQGYVHGHLLMRLRAGDGTLKTISQTIWAVRDEDGRIKRLQGLCRDISAQVRAQQELQRRNSELQLLHQLAMRLSGPIDLREAFETGLDLIMTFTGVQGALVLLRDAGHARAFDSDDLDATMPRYQIVAQRGATRTPDTGSYPFHLIEQGVNGLPSESVFLIQHGAEMYGALVICLQGNERLSEHDNRLIRSVSAQLGLAIHAQRLFADLERQGREFQAITRIGRLIQYSPDVESALPTVAREIRDLLGASYVVFHLLRGDHFEFVAASDARESKRTLPIAAYERRLLESAQPLVIVDRDAPEVDARQREIMTELGMRAALGVRLIAHRQPLGLVFINQQEPRHWNDGDIRLAESFARQIEAALENKCLFDHLQAQLRGLRALAHVGEFIGTMPNPDDALHMAAKEIARALSADYVAFHLRQDHTLRLVAESASIGAPTISPIAASQYRILDDLETIWVCDREQDAVDEEQQRALEQYGFVADLGAPLVARQQAIGILYISQRTKRDWTEDEIRLAETFAHQIAAALENTRLLHNLQSQVRVLRALARTADLLARSRSPESALAPAAEELAGLLQADYCGFHLLDGNEFYAITDRRSRWAGMRYPRQPYHDPVLEYFETILVTDRDKDAKSEAQRRFLQKLGFAAKVGAPMAASRQAIGILVVCQRAPRVWKPEEIQLVETYAQYIANVLANVKLLEEKEARLQEMERLAQLNEILVTQPNEEVLADLALTAARELVAVDLVALLMIEGEQLKPVRLFGGQPHPEQPPPWNSLLRHIQATKEIVVIDPNHSWPLDPQTAERIRYYGIQAHATAPLVAADKVIGFLSFAYKNEHVFTPSEIQLIQTAAIQLGLAFANARLYGDLQMRIEKLHRLAEFSRLCGTIHDSQQLQQTAVEYICKMLDAKAVSIRLVEGDHLTVGACYGYVNPQARAHPIRIDAFLGHLLESDKPHPIPDLANDPSIPEHYLQRHLAEGFASALMARMIAEGKTIGLLTIFRGEIHAWSKEEMQYAQTVANTVGLALANVRQAEATARQKDELRATLDSVFSGVLTTDEEGTILSWNRAAEEITGFNEVAMRGQNWNIVGPRVGELRHPDMLIHEAMAEGSVCFGVALRRFRRADGTEILLRAAAAPLRDRTGAVRGAVYAFWDRTREQAAEMAKVDFINEVAHDIGSTLGTILTSAQELQNPQLRPERLREHLLVIADTVEHLQAFHKRFIDFQQEKMNKGLEEDRVDLKELIRQKVQALRAQKPHRTLRIEGQFDYVLADPSRLQSVLSNLLTNAIKYSPPRSRITIRSKLRNSNELWLSIHNTGKPIPPELHTTIFKRGKRGDHSQEGSGLGLWIVQTKLREMGGDIRVESDARRGTTFLVTLRRAVSPPLPNHASGEKEKGHDSSQTQALAH